MTAHNGKETRSQEVDRKVGARIRMVRLERRLSQESLAGQLGVTFQQIQRYEKGANTVPAARIPRLCQILRILPNDLFEGYEYNADDLAVIGKAAIKMGVRFEQLGPKGRGTIARVLDQLETAIDA